MLNPFTAGQKDTAAAHVAAIDQRRTVYQSADSASSTSTTFLSSTGLVLSVVASGQYAFSAWILVDTNATADVNLKVLLPASATVRFADKGSTSTSTSTTRFYSGVAAGTIIACSFEGFIDIDTTAGTATMQYAQNAVSGSTFLKLGSWMELVQVA